MCFTDEWGGWHVSLNRWWTCFQSSKYFSSVRVVFCNRFSNSWAFPALSDSCRKKGSVYIFEISRNSEVVEDPSFLSFGIMQSNKQGQQVGFCFQKALFGLLSSCRFFHLFFDLHFLIFTHMWEEKKDHQIPRTLSGEWKPQLIVFQPLMMHKTICWIVVLWAITFL